MTRRIGPIESYGQRPSLDQLKRISTIEQLSLSGGGEYSVWKYNKELSRLRDRKIGSRRTQSVDILLDLAAGIIHSVIQSIAR